MKKCFVSKKFKSSSLLVIGQANEIIEEYKSQGLRMSLRQLYYQFVSKNLIANSDKSYDRLASIISDARLAGLVDWSAIEDRGRVPVVPAEWENVASIMESAISSYRKRRWRTQSKVVELWVEKQALAGVLEPLASEFHVVLSVNKGYSSSSAMYEAAGRISRASTRYSARAKQAYVLYLGDHDPSGEDMVRDIYDRLNLFRDPGVPSIIVEKLALTRSQIDEYEPPPNPAKSSDSRFKKYEERHGDESWEVDALPPNVLQQIIRDRITSLIDWSAMNAVIEEEKADKKAMSSVAKRQTERIIENEDVDDDQSDDGDGDGDGDPEDNYEDWACVEAPEGQGQHPLNWGEAHWAVFRYAASLDIDPERMRCNPEEHPEHAVEGGQVWEEGDDTITRVGYIRGHDDWSCLHDIVESGLLRIVSIEKGKYTTTNKGVFVLSMLQNHLNSDGDLRTFRLRKYPI
jgi:hypothetical protein